MLDRRQSPSLCVLRWRFLCGLAERGFWYVFLYLEGHLFSYGFWRGTIQPGTNGDWGRCVGRRGRGKAGQRSKDALCSDGPGVPSAHRCRWVPTSGRRKSVRRLQPLWHRSSVQTPPRTPRECNCGSRSPAWEGFKVLPPTAFSPNWSLATSEACGFDWGAGGTVSKSRCTRMGFDLGFPSLGDDPLEDLRKRMKTVCLIPAKFARKGTEAPSYTSV